MVYAFGERWGPESDVPDKIIDFRPGNGVHDIHMNQGHVGAFRKDDGVWQDGGLIIELPDQQRWVGIFLAFQSQSWHTDDVTGHTLADGPIEEFGAEPVRIVAALVNPVGPAPEAETVIHRNAVGDRCFTRSCDFSPDSNCGSAMTRPRPSCTGPTSITSSPP